MAKLSIKPDSTSVSLLLFIQDSASTTGGGKTGLAYNSGSLTCYGVRPGEAAAAISLVTQTVTGAWSSGGFVEIDSANMPGMYRFDVPNARLAAGVRSSAIMFKGASGMAPLTLEIDLNAEVNVTYWLGAAAPANTGDSYARLGAPAGASVSADVLQIKNYVDDIGAAGAGLTALGDTRLANLDATVSSRSTYAGGAVASVTGNVGGNVVGSVGSVSGDTKQTADVATLITTVGVAGAGLTALATQASVNTIDDFLDTEIAAILADTNELQTDLVNGGRLDLLIDAIKAKTDNLPASPAAVGSAMTLTAAYDAAKTAATQTSVDDLPTNAELAIAFAGADDAVLVAIAALNNLSSAGAQSAAAAALTAYGVALQTSVDDLEGRLTATRAGYLDNLSAGSVATASALATVAGYVDTEVAAILAAVDTEVAAIKAKTDNLPTNPADESLLEAAITSAVSPLATAASIAALNNISSAQVQTAATAALNAYDPPTNTEMEARTLAAANYATATVLDAVDNFIDTEVAAIKAVTDKLDTALELDGAVYRYTINALEQAPAGGGGGATAADIRIEMDANSTKLAAILEDTGTTLPASIAGLNDLSSADVQAAATASLTAYDPSTKAELDTAVAGLATTAALAVVDAVVDNILADTGTIRSITDHLDVSSVITQTPPSNAGTLTVTLGQTFNQPISGLVIPVDLERAYFTIKRDVEDEEEDAVVQLLVSNPANPSTDGLLRLNAVLWHEAVVDDPLTDADETSPEPFDQGLGSFTVNQAGGSIHVYLTDDLTAQLPTAKRIGWDVKFIDSNGDSTGKRGIINLVRTETQTV